MTFSVGENLRNRHILLIRNVEFDSETPIWGIYPTETRAYESI